MSVRADDLPSLDTRRPRVSFTVDEAIVLLGVLRMAPAASDQIARDLSGRVVERVSGRVDDALRGYLPAPAMAVGESEEAVRLARRLRSGLDELDELVGVIETMTEPDERPIVLVAASQVASRALAFRIHRLAGD